MKKVIVLAGPTASGKTSLSIKIAKALNLEIINGDSVAIYQDLDIGSAKITEQEKEGVKHHLLSVVPAGQPYSVYDYQIDVRKSIDNVNFPMIVGGSGFYIKSSLYNYQFDDEIDTIESNYSIEEKIQFIEEKDPNFIFDKQNKRRVDRAFSQIKQGSKPSEKIEKNEPLYDILMLYLDMPRDRQMELMIKRVDKQIEDGFIDEVTNLRNKGVVIDNIIGYREINQYLDGEISLDEAKDKIVKTTFQFSKRQKTWFLNQMNPIMINPLSNTVVEDSIEIIKNFLAKK